MAAAALGSASVSLSGARPQPGAPAFLRGTGLKRNGAPTTARLPSRAGRGAVTTQAGIVESKHSTDVGAPPPPSPPPPRVFTSTSLSI